MNKLERELSHSRYCKQMNDIRLRMIDGVIKSTKAQGRKRVYNIHVLSQPDNSWSWTDIEWEKYGSRSYSRQVNHINVVVTDIKGRKLTVITETGSERITLPRLNKPVVRTSALTGELQWIEAGKLRRTSAHIPTLAPRMVYYELNPDTHKVWLVNDKSCSEISITNWRIIHEVAKRNGWHVRGDSLGLAWVNPNMTVAAANDTDSWYHVYDLQTRGTRIINGNWEAVNAKAAFAYRERENKRKERNKQLDTELNFHGDAILVTVQDSLAAGNCNVGTREFVDVAKVYFDGWTPSVLPANVVLHIRDDNFTRRACRVAALRELSSAEKELVPV